MRFSCTVVRDRNLFFIHIPATIIRIVRCDSYNGKKFRGRARKKKKLMRNQLSSVTSIAIIENS